MVYRGGTIEALVTTMDLGWVSLIGLNVNSGVWVKCNFCKLSILVAIHRFIYTAHFRMFSLAELMMLYLGVFSSLPLSVHTALSS